MEDWNALRTWNKKAVSTHFMHGCQFRIEIVDWLSFSELGRPEDFDLFVKDITYSPIEIEVEAIKVGASTLTFPIGSGPVLISMTMRDHEDMRIYKWFDRITAKVMNPDCTINLPAEYMMRWNRYTLLQDGGEVLSGGWDAYPTKLGDITESVDAQGFLEFPIQFQQFRSI